MQRRSGLLIGSVLLGLVAVGSSGCLIVDDDSPDSTLTIDNASSYVITEVNVASVGTVSWGPNLLPAPLFPDDSLVISLDCDTYDVRVVDNGVPAAECILYNFDLCFDNGYWTLTDGTLNSCAF